MNNVISMPTKRDEFIVLSAGGGTINAGTAAGAILTLTPPSGQRVRVTNLSGAAGTTIANLTLTFGATNLITGSVEGQFPISASQFSIGSFQPYVGAVPPLGNHKYITGKTDEDFIITASALTGATLYYAYEFGE